LSCRGRLQYARRLKRGQQRQEIRQEFVAALAEASGCSRHRLRQSFLFPMQGFTLLIQTPTLVINLGIRFRAQSPDLIVDCSAFLIPLLLENRFELVNLAT
jgi:hypothetical protein